VALLCGTSVGLAEGLSAEIAVTSDYVQHGLSQSRGDPAVQSGLTYRARTGLYGGLWASTVDTGLPEYGLTGADAEVDAFAGYHYASGADFDFDLQVVRYSYLGANDRLDYDRTEVSASIDYRSRLRAALSYSPDFSGVSHAGVANDERVVTAEVSFQQPLNEHVTLGIGLGHRDLDAPFGSDYQYGSLGVGIGFGRISVMLAQHWTDDTAHELFGEEIAGDRTTVTVLLDLSPAGAR